MNAPLAQPDRLDRRIIALAVPAAGSSLLLVVHRAVDMAFCEQLGTEAIAALTVSTISVWIYAALGMLAGMGLTALVARYAGAGRVEAGGYVARQGMLWAFVIGLGAAAVGVVAAPLLFQAAQASPQVTSSGIGHARIYWAGGAFVMVQVAGDAVFRGHGNTRTPFRVAVVALTCNVVLDPILIFGWGPIPALGVPGAAWATILAAVLSAVLIVHALRSAGHLHKPRPPDDALRFDARTPLGRPGLLGLDPSVLRRVARVGLPTALASLCFNLIYLVLVRFAEQAGRAEAGEPGSASAEAGGAAAQAGLGIGHTGEGVAYVLGLGWASAAAALVGRRLGANDPEGAERAAWRAALQCATLCGLWSIVLFTLDEQIAGLFADEVAARDYAAAYYRIVAICLIPQAVELVLDGAFGGAGLTLPPTLIGITFSLARIPLAWLAAFELGWGVEGIWWVIMATAAARAFVVAFWFRRGTWKERSV